MYLLSQPWIYLLAAGAVGALLGALCYRLFRVGRLQNEMLSLRTTADAEVGRLRSRLIDVEGQRAQLLDRLNSLDSQFETLRTSSERTLDSFNDRVHELENALNRRDEQLRSAEIRAHSEISAHAQTKVRMQELTEKLRQAEAAYTAAKEELENLYAELGTLRVEIVGARDTVHDINAAARAREQTLQAEIEEMRQEVGEVGSRLAYALQAEQSAKSRLVKAQASVDAAVEREQQIVKEQSGSQVALAEQVRNLQAQLARAETATATSQEQARSAESSSGELRQQLQDLRTKHQHAEQDVQRLRDELRANNERQSVADKENNAQRNELTTLRQREQTLVAEHAELGRQIVELSSQLKEASVLAQRQREELQFRSQREAGSGEEVSRLRRELEEARNALRIAKSREETLLAEVSGMQSKASSGRAEIERLTAELKAMRDEQSRPSNRNFKPSIVASMDASKLEKLVLAAGDGRKPANTTSRELGEFDDLKEIGGIGPVNEKWLHDQGIFYFWQIASWVPEEMAWVAQNLPNFGTRVYRENWVAQAMRLARGETTSAKRKYKDGKHV